MEEDDRYGAPRIRSNVGAAIRRAIDRANTTQAWVAEQMPCQPKTLNRYVIGDRMAPVPFLLRLAEVTDTTFVALLSDAGIIEQLDGNVPLTIQGDPHLSPEAKRQLLAGYRAVAGPPSKKGGRGKRLV